MNPVKDFMNSREFQSMKSEHTKDMAIFVLQAIQAIGKQRRRDLLFVVEHRVRDAELQRILVRLVDSGVVERIVKIPDNGKGRKKPDVYYALGAIYR